MDNYSNKKILGFTLVELLAVIVLLGVLSVVIIPKVGDSVTNSKNNAYQTQLLNIRKGVEDFLIENTYLIENDGIFTLKLGVIKQGGYLPINIKNPLTRKDFSNESLILVIKNGDKYDIELYLEDVIEVNEEIDNNSPILVLNGEYVQYVDVNSEYKELGARAKSVLGEDIRNISIQMFLDDVEVGSIDTKHLNNYKIIYRATDQNGRDTSATRTVIVRDNISPVISSTSETTLYESEVNDYDLMDGVVISDNYDSEFNVDVTSELSNIPGKYVITYNVSDSSGNNSVFRKVINVLKDSDFYTNYTRVDYIKTNGNQHIELDYKAKRNTKVELDIEFIENGNSMLNYNEKGTGFSNILGVNKDEGYRFNANFGANSEGYNIIYYWLDKPYVTGDKSYNNKYDDIYKRSLMTLESGSVTFQDITHTIQAKTQDNSVSMVLLGNYNPNFDKIISFERHDAKIYEFKIYEKDVLIKHMVPCYRKSDNVYGLYDLLEERFYKSDGNSEFVY